jgi:hypothetical protein
VIDSSAANVWNLLVDTQQWPVWGPSVRAVICPDRYIGLHSTGRIQTSLGVWVGFTITDFIEHTYWSWRVAGIPATGHRLEALDSQRCRLIFEIPFIAFPYAYVCKIALTRIQAHVKILSFY